MRDLAESSRNKWTARDWICCVLVWTISLLTIYIAVATVVTKCNHRNFKPQASVESVAFGYENVQIGRDDAIALCNRHFGGNYLLVEKPLAQKGYIGRAFPQFRLIFIDDKISGLELIETLAHELCHLKYFTDNEAFTQYMTFVELYESGNYILRQAALRIADTQCRNGENVHAKYDCGAYIKKYMENKK